MVRNQSRIDVTDTAETQSAILALEAIQKIAPKKESLRWWSRGYFFEHRGRLSRRAFEAALASIREHAAPNWIYVERGRESAYCVIKFVDHLPQHLRPDAEEVAASHEREFERHAIDTIDVGLREYHAALNLALGHSQPQPEDFADRAVNPYYAHIAALIAAGRLKAPGIDVPEEPPAGAVDILGMRFGGNPASAKAKFLLDVKSALALRARGTS